MGAHGGRRCLQQGDTSWSCRRSRPHRGGALLRRGVLRARAVLPSGPGNEGLDRDERARVAERRRESVDLPGEGGEVDRRVAPDLLVALDERQVLHGVQLPGVDPFRFLQPWRSGRTESEGRTAIRNPGVRVPMPLDSLTGPPTVGHPRRPPGAVMGYGVIGNTAVSGTVVLGSSPGTPAKRVSLKPRTSGLGWESSGLKPIASVGGAFVVLPAELGSAIAFSCPISCAIALGWLRSCVNVYEQAREQCAE